MHWNGVNTYVHGAPGLKVSPLQVSVYPDGHEKTDGLQLKRQPGSRASRCSEQWKGKTRYKSGRKTNRMAADVAQGSPAT
jgi:hypothetical protein